MKYTYQIFGIQKYQVKVTTNTKCLGFGKGLKWMTQFRGVKCFKQTRTHTFLDNVPLLPVGQISIYKYERVNDMALIELFPGFTKRAALNSMIIQINFGTLSKPVRQRRSHNAIICWFHVIVLVLALGSQVKYQVTDS